MIKAAPRPQVLTSRLLALKRLRRMTPNWRSWRKHSETSGPRPDCPFPLFTDSCMCGDIVEHLPLAQSTVSQHLKMLKASGLIRGTIDGPRVCYFVEKKVLERFKQLASGL